MKRLFFTILVLIVSLTVGYRILFIWRGISLYQADLSKENLLKAIQVNPSNPDPFYKLGLFYQWDIQNIDLKESVHYFLGAIERNPLEQEYWINLARIFQRTGEKHASEQSLEKAIQVFPAGYQGRWVTGNLFLQQGEFEKALLHFSYLLNHYPNQSPMVYDVLRKAANSDFILEKVVPKNPVSFRQYLSYLYGEEDKESAQEAWQKRDSFDFKPDRNETLQHIEFLIARNELNEAYSIWKARLHDEGLSFPSDGNLMTNSGFEMEKILGGGFDWKIDKAPGVEVSFDSMTAFEGKRSLKIVFNGKENIDFSHIYQFVSMKANTEYLLKANIKTKRITTKSGLKIEILGVGPAFYHASETSIGDHEWKELVVTFRTPAQSQGGLMRVRREKTDKFDRFISGTVWLDNFSLKETKGHERTQ
jgi:hypothetical protein